MIKKILIISVFILLLLPLGVFAADNGMLTLPAPDLSINIPTMHLSPVQCDSFSCSVPWIGEYIAGVYKYAISIVGILATIIMMIGGFLWLTAGGNQSKIGEAKSWITASVTGLIIALSSYMILYQINPELVKFKPLAIERVQKLEEIKAQYEQKSCSALTTEQKQSGFTALITGYCRPKSSSFKDRHDFLCAVGLNCTCPNNDSKSPTRDCSNDAGTFSWRSCLDFNDKTTAYCNSTASNGTPGQGQVAADWNCFGKNSSVCINGTTYTVTDKGSAIKGSRFDVWVNNCSEALKITGTTNVKAGACQ